MYLLKVLLCTIFNNIYVYLIFSVKHVEMKCNIHYRRIHYHISSVIIILKLSLLLVLFLLLLLLLLLLLMVAVVVV